MATYCWKYSYLIAAFAIIFGCDTNKSENGESCEVTQNKILNYEILDSISIDVSGLQYSFLSTKITKLDSVNYYVGYDVEKHKIDFFDLNVEKYSHSIYLQDSGPNKLVDCSAFYYHNRDSIFVATSGYYFIYLINSEGEKINEWDFLSSELPDSLASRNDISGTFGIGGIDRYGISINYLSKTEELLAHIFIVPLEQENTFPTSFELPTLAKYDINRGKINDIFGSYPPDYFGDEIPHDMFLSYAVNPNGQIVVSFLSSPNLYTNSEGSYDFLCVGSNYISEFDIEKYDKSIAGTVEEFWKNYQLNPSYLKLIYDKYRKKYYRIAKHKLPEFDSSGLRPDILQATWSIIVINDKLEVEGEILFPREEYDFMDIHVVEEGILLSKNNPWSSSNSEEELKFDIIKFKNE